MTFLPRRAFIAGSAVAGLAAPHAARAAMRTVRIGHNNTDPSHYGQGATTLAQAVAEHPALAGVLAITVHGNAALGDELGMLRQIANGTLDLMICSNSVIGNVVPEAGLLNAPFLFKDIAAARRALDGAVGAEMAEAARAKEVQVLAWGENGLRHVTASRPVLTPSDLNGLRIRVPQSEVMMNGMRALGAAAKPLSFSLLREALRTGEFEGQENPIVVIEAVKLNELQSHLSLTGHIYDAAPILCSSDMLEDLSAPQRAALAACAAKAAAATRQVAASAEQQGIARLKAAGMIVHDTVDRAAFAAAAQPYLQGLGSTFGADRVQRVLAAGGL